MKKIDWNIVIIMRGAAMVAAIIVFGVLAKEFGRWWIALFSLLYSYSLTVKEIDDKSKEAEDG